MAQSLLSWGAFLFYAAATALMVSAASVPAYWDRGLFLELRSLAVELDGARLANLAPGGQALWESGGMSVPESSATTLRGDFTRSAREQRAVLFESDEAGEKRFFLLIAEKRERAWRRLLVHELKERLPGSLVWDGGRRVLAVATDKRRRRAKTATMTADGDGIRSQSHGAVIEETFVIPFQWDAKSSRFKAIAPYWLDLWAIRKR